MIYVRLPPEINHPTLCFGGHGVTALPCLVIFWRKPNIAITAHVDRGKTTLAALPFEAKRPISFVATLD